MLPSRKEDPFLFWGYLLLAVVWIGGSIAVTLVRGPLWGLFLFLGLGFALKPLWSDS